jgi:hypothetical protein
MSIQQVKHRMRPSAAQAVGLVGLMLSSAIASSALADDAAVRVRLDQQTQINGYDVACTGIGEASRQDARWASYPVRIEFARPDKSYQADATVTITTAAGKPVLAAHCNGPWFLVKAPKGVYKVQAQLDGRAKVEGTTFSPPESGQRRVILTFPMRAAQAASPANQ